MVKKRLTNQAADHILYITVRAKRVRATESPK